MKIKNIIFSFAIIGLCLLTSCKTDNTATSASAQGATVENHDGHDHAGHDHSGHDHAGHDHSGHDHSGHDDHSTAQSGSKIVNTPSTPEEKAKAIAQAEADKLLNATNNTDRVDVSKRGIANPCKLITAEWLKKNTSLKVSEPRFKKGSGIINDDNRSCFVQWEQDGDPNIGFLINVMINPIPEEITDFPQTYMVAKKRDGETMVGNDKAFPYKRIEGLGVEALGCYELGKYYFRQDNDFLFMLAFNMDVSQAQQFKAVKQLGNEILKNYYAAIAQ